MQNPPTVITEVTPAISTQPAVNFVPPPGAATTTLPPSSQAWPVQTGKAATQVPPVSETLVHTETVNVSTDDKNRGVKGFFSKVARPFKYQGKRHGVMASEFTHDSAVAESINTLKNFSREYTDLSRNVDALLDTEKTYSIALLRNGHRLVENSHQFHTSRVANHLKGYSELQLQLAQLHSNFVSNNLTEISWFLKNFNKSNIKNSKLVKHELNIAAMNREEYVKAYTSKAEKESKNYFSEKHDDLGLRLAEERKIMSQHQYELAAQKMEASMMELYEFEAKELVPQLQVLIEAQKQYYINALNILTTAQQTINSLPIEGVTLPLQRKGSLLNAQLPILPTATIPGTATQLPTGVPSSTIAPSSTVYQVPPSVGTTSGLPASTLRPGETTSTLPMTSTSTSTVTSTLVPNTEYVSTSSMPSSSVYPSAALDAKQREQRIEELQQQLGGTGISPAKFVHNA